MAPEPGRDLSGRPIGMPTSQPSDRSGGVPWWRNRAAGGTWLGCGAGWALAGCLFAVLRRDTTHVVLALLDALLFAGVGLVMLLTDRRARRARARDNGPGAVENP